MTPSGPVRGNGVATAVVARWEGALDVARMNSLLNGQVVEDAVAADAVPVRATAP